MKNIILISILVLCCIGLYSQSISPDDLLFVFKNKSKNMDKPALASITYCKKDSTPYTGHINGEIIFDKYNVCIAKMFYIKMWIESHYFLSGFCPECDSIYGLIIDGEFIDGKESGHWNFYNIKDSTKIAECDYIDGLIDGPIYLYEKNTNGDILTDIVEPFHCRHCLIIFYNQKKLKKRSYKQPY